MTDKNGSSTLFIIDSLSKHFAEHLLTIDKTIAPVISQALWQDVANHYSEPVRAYHNLTHLQQLFEHFEQIKCDLRQPSIVALALFYHDVIYHPKSSDNELKSAEYASEVLSTYLTVAQTERIYHLIMMTAKHQLDDMNSINGYGYEQDFDSDAAYLLDMDLSILGAPWSKYEQYTKAVRQEYHHLTTADYRVGRTRVLEDLLDHPTLYLTGDYYQRLEAQARENIKREIALLAT